MKSGDSNERMGESAQGNSELAGGKGRFYAHSKAAADGMPLPKESLTISVMIEPSQPFYGGG